jgi:hypothetical protein
MTKLPSGGPGCRSRILLQAAEANDIRISACPLRVRAFNKNPDQSATCKFPSQ